MIPSTLQPLIDDPHVTDICFNDHHEIYFDAGAGMSPYSGAEIFEDEKAYRDFVLHHLSASGKTWDAKHPFVDTVFFCTHRAHIAFPPLSTRGIALSLRRLPLKETRGTLERRENAVTRWRATAAAFKILQLAVQNHESIVFAGGTGSGKTTLLNDLMSWIGDHERVITIEDTPEIQSPHAHTLNLITRTANADGYGAVTQRDLFKQTLRMRPDRILVGECRGDEVLDLLQALNSGHRGFMSTVHANSARDALKRVELLALIAARGTIPIPLIQDLMVNGIQLLVHLERRDGKRVITQIHRVHGRERDVIQTRVLFKDEAPGENPRGLASQTCTV